MSIWYTLFDLFTFHEPTQKQPFELLETDEDQDLSSNKSKSPPPETPEKENQADTGQKKSRFHLFRRNPSPQKGDLVNVDVIKEVAEILKESPEQKKDQQESGAQNVQGGPQSNLNKQPLVLVDANIKNNVHYIGKAFAWPEDNGLVMREFVIGNKPGLKAVVVYLEGLVKHELLNQTVFQPLRVYSASSNSTDPADLHEIKQHLLTGIKIDTHEDMTKIIQMITSGFTALFFHGLTQALVVDTSSWPHRAVENSVSERVIRGPQEGFTENLITNVALVRRLIRDPQLVKESHQIGQRAHTQCALLYIKDLANPKLVKEVRRRIQSLDIDFIQNSGSLERLIEDNPAGLYPLSLATERPDRVANSLMTGKVVLLLEGDPFVLILPSTFWNLMRAAEDYSNRGLISLMQEGTRWFATMLLLLLPGFYLAIVEFHQEMIPTDLLLAIAANREKVPFPSVFEVLLMEIAFELIREAGARIPGIIGPTLGIVGAIILGQAAVAANFVNPVVILVVALTGISSFTIPSYSLATHLRIHRFIYTVMGACIGLFGLAFYTLVQIAFLASLKSIGVPYLAPLSPVTNSKKGLFSRNMVWRQERREDSLGVQDRYNQGPITRKWILNPNHPGERKKK